MTTAAPDRAAAAPRRSDRPKLAVLFWCYKNIPICQDRLRHIREQNPDAPIYILFGGNLSEADRFDAELGPLADDFCAFRGGRPDGIEFTEEYRGGVYWKYVHGDLMFSWWYENRGRDLEWDTVIVVQWDMLVFGPLDEAFAFLGRDEIVFSGLRPIREVEETWAWVAESNPQARRSYLEFLDYVRDEYGYDQEPMCCVAVVLGLPRLFLEKFCQVGRPQLGGLEYRLPIYAQVFGIRFSATNPFEPWWGAVEKFQLRHTLRARPIEIWAPTIAYNLLRRSGARVFHPYWRPAPRGILGWTWALLDSVPRLLWTTLWMTLVGNRLLRTGSPQQ